LAVYVYANLVIVKRRRERVLDAGYCGVDRLHAVSIVQPPAAGGGKGI
jgi:hypothetical protein